MIRVAGIVSVVFVTSVVCPASAQDGSDGNDKFGATLTRPVVRGSTDVPYPSDARGDATVLMELVVEKDGTVSRGSVIEGAEPFAAQARRFASAWRFAPAIRGGTPIAARIRVRIDFHEDHKTEPRRSPNGLGLDTGGGLEGGGLSSQADFTPTLPAVTPSDASDSPLEVTVLGHRREVGQTTISDAEVREMPGAFGDPFRAIEALPSVTPVVSGLPYFYVRGAPPNDNGYFVDGIRVPFLFHIGVGQGVIHPGLIDRVDFFPGVAPASYGDGVGAIVAGQTHDPAAVRHGEASLRLVDAGALAESPFGKDGRGTVLVAGRYGYPGPILGAVTSDLEISYWDYQARATWRVGDRGTLGAFVFGSHDRLATPSPSGDETVPPIEQLVSDFHRVDLRYDHALADGHVRFAVTGGYDRRGAAPTYVRDRSLAARVEMESALSSAAKFRGGARVQLDDYGFDQNPNGPGDPVPVPSTADPPPTNLATAAHADVVWRPSPRIEIVPGLRFGVFDSWRADALAGTGRVRTTVPALDPRLSVRVTVVPALTLVSTVGRSHQYPALRAGEIPAPFVSVPGFPFGNKQLQSASQVSQGAEVALPADISLSATGFFSYWSGLVDLTTATCPLVGQPPAYQCPDDHPVSGRAYGFELLVRRSLSKRLGGWLSYTLSRSTRDAHFITPAGDTVTAHVPSEFDRTHLLSAILSYDLGARWRVGGRSVFYTGTPYSNVEEGLPAPPYNAYRNPGFFRLDLRAEKRWPFGEGGSVALVIEVQNVTLSTETIAFGQSCTGDPGLPTQCTQKRSKIGPITIPSIGIEIRH